MLRQFLLAVLLMTLSACVSVPAQKQATLHGDVIETLQGPVNISLTTSTGKMSGNGILFYQRPASFRLTLLAPFGQSILDIVVNGEKVICLMESKGKVWVGSMQELPEWIGTQLWPLLAWAVEPPKPAGPALERIFIRADSTFEKIYYDTSGFVQRKVNEIGDEVVYSDYRRTDGIAVPNVIEIRASEGSTLRLAFDEPEVNRSIDSDILNPQIDRYAIISLEEFKGYSNWQ